MRENIQVDVRLDTEAFVDLIQHFPVLTGHRHDHAELPTVLQSGDDRSEFDRLRPGAVDDHYGHWHSTYLTIIVVGGAEPL